MFREDFGFPVELPDLRPLKPPGGNSNKGSENSLLLRFEGERTTSRWFTTFSNPHETNQSWFRWSTPTTSVKFSKGPGKGRTVTKAEWLASGDPLHLLGILAREGK